jgi:hypothetical protein
MRLTYSSKGERCRLLRSTWKQKRSLTSEPRNKIQNTVSPRKKKQERNGKTMDYKARPHNQSHKSVLSLNYISYSWTWKFFLKHTSHGWAESLMASMSSGFPVSSGGPAMVTLLTVTLNYLRYCKSKCYPSDAWIRWLVTQPNTDNFHYQHQNSTGHRAAIQKTS